VASNGRPVELDFLLAYSLSVRREVEHVV
jgi:hypothetical protein